MSRRMLESTGKFSTKSLYNSLAASIGPEELTEVWHVRLPHRTKIFLWQLIRGRLPSGDKVLKRNGHGDGQCPLCGIEEDLDHISFYCVRA